jgi:hypothetical protein
MGARIFYRKEGVLPFVASSLNILQLSRNYHVRQYILTLKATVVNGATPVYFNDNLFNLINSIRLVGNGNVNLKQIPAEKLVYNSIINKGIKGKTSIVKTASGTFEQYQTATIDLIVPDSFRPEDTLLNTKVFDTLNLEVNWADSVALGTGVTVESASLEVSSFQMIGFEGNLDKRVAYYKEVGSKYSVTADSDNYLITLPVQQFYEGFLLTAKKANLLNSNIIKNIRIKSGTTIFIDLPAETIQRENEFSAGIKSDVSNEGLYYLDFTPRGYLTDMLNTVVKDGGFNTLELELVVKNTDATTVVNVYYNYLDFLNDNEATLIKNS